MSANEAEIKNFFWHCLVAARLLDEFKIHTVTKGYVVRAVRMATDCWTGRNGVQYASHNAIREAKGNRWEQCGLIKEHIVPVSLISAHVTNELRATRDKVQVARPLVLRDQDRQGLTTDVIELFQLHPRAWEVARIIRERTHHAWITADENKRFDEKDRHGGISIRKRMPKDWTEEKGIFARYDACEIVLSRI